MVADLENVSIKVKKITDVSLLQDANSFTTGNESKMSLSKGYRFGHSPIRTQLFWIEMRNIPLFVASQLVRSHIGVQFFQRSKRIDRGGADFMSECDKISLRLSKVSRKIGVLMSCEKVKECVFALNDIVNKIDALPKLFDRNAATDLAFIANAEALINMAHKRMCSKASLETRIIIGQLKNEMQKVDFDLSEHLVPQCIYRGGICPEPKSCGYNTSDRGIEKIKEYKNLMGN